MLVRRRSILKAGLATGSLFLPFPHAWVWAQSEGALKLLRAPKVALVLGNSRYKDAPLKNPANDATAIGEALSASGFLVTTKINAGRSEMAAAIEAYAKDLAARKCVGVFYYAGHGIQLSWKNYMLPVDANIDTIDDVQKKAVEVNALLEGLTRAANPLNVIILDACRDNPFGSARPTQAKGLSQMDAPNLTLLAYATSPGNVASDGEGANGLYTENLLREMRVPEAKIEDVFKRVRLGVRRKSNGAQVPWESTSLEEDFWFIPPKDLKEASEAEREKQFQEEFATWERVKDAAQPGPLEDYLRRYPSGDFAELAQLQLERVLAKQGEKKVLIASQEGNPFTKGSAQANTRWRLGDSYTYRITDILNGNAQRQAVHTVTEITENEVHFSNGQVNDLLGNVLRRGGGRIYTANQLEPLEYVVGKQWSTRYRITTPRGETGQNEMQLRIAAREPVTVPAGTFNAYRIEGTGVFEEEAGKVETTRLKKWVVPEQLRREVAMEEIRERSGGRGRGGGGRAGRHKGGGGRVTASMRWELLSYKQS